MKPLLLVFFILLTSCDYFQSKKVSTEQLLEEEMQAINWNDVDEYPSFSDCDEAITNLEKKACFENHLHEFLVLKFSQPSISIGNICTFRKFFLKYFIDFNFGICISKVFIFCSH